MWDLALNFNYIFLFFLLFGCGVKGDPIAPQNQTLPSVLENYPDISPDKPLNDAKVN
jgi:hypothetical protein